MWPSSSGVGSLRGRARRALSVGACREARDWALSRAVVDTLLGSEWRPLLAPIPGIDIAAARRYVERRASVGLPCSAAKPSAPVATARLEQIRPRSCSRRAGTDGVHGVEISFLSPRAGEACAVVVTSLSRHGLAPPRSGNSDESSSGGPARHESEAAAQAPTVRTPRGVRSATTHTRPIGRSMCTGALARGAAAG